MKKKIIFSDPTLLLFDTERFENSRAIALGNLANSILTSSKFKSIEKKEIDYTKCISGVALLNVISDVLSDTEQTIIKLRFSLDGDFKTLLELGNMLNVTDSAISSAQRKAINKLVDFYQLYSVPFFTIAEKNVPTTIFIKACDDLTLGAYYYLKQSGVYTLNQFSAMTQQKQLRALKFNTQQLKQIQQQCLLYGLPPCHSLM